MDTNSIAAPGRARRHGTSGVQRERRLETMGGCAAPARGRRAPTAA